MWSVLYLHNLLLVRHRRILMARTQGALTQFPLSPPKTSTRGRPRCLHPVSVRERVAKFRAARSPALNMLDNLRHRARARPHQKKRKRGCSALRVGSVCMFVDRGRRLQRGEVVFVDPRSGWTLVRRLTFAGLNWRHGAFAAVPTTMLGVTK